MRWWLEAMPLRYIGAAAGMRRKIWSKCWPCILIEPLKNSVGRYKYSCVAGNGGEY